MKFSAQQIADFLQGEIIGDPQVTVDNLSKIEEGTPGTLSFLANPKYTHHIYIHRPASYSCAGISLQRKKYRPLSSK